MQEWRYENCIPGWLAAMIIWRYGQVDGVTKLAVAWCYLMLIGQGMVLCQTFDRKGWFERLEFFVVNEIGMGFCLVVLLALQLATWTIVG